MGKRVAARDAVVMAAVGIALVLIAIGAGSRHDGPGQFHFTHRDGIVLSIALGVAAVAVVTAVLAARRLVRPRLREMLAAAAILALLALLTWWLSLSTAAKPRGNRPAVTPPPPPHNATGSSTPSHRLHISSLQIVPIVVAGLIVVMAATAIVFAVRRRENQPKSSDDESAVMPAVFAALDAGEDAMRDISDPRQAIIACYAAMEGALATVGVRRLAAETPNDLLARAALFRDAHEPARRLTELFLEARFSSHPMSNADRDDARAALGQLRKPENLVGGGIT